MSQYSRQSFFFQQKKRPLVHRVHKPLDTLSIFGDKREPILTFRPGRVESARHRLRPFSSVSRLSGVPIIPPVDPAGPHFTTAANQVIPESIEKKQSLYHSFGQIDEDNQTTDPLKYKFNEIKIASTGILSKLHEHFELFTVGISLPESLVRILSMNFEQLVTDVIIEKREWQTDCYLDYKPRIERSEHSTKDDSSERQETGKQRRQQMVTIADKMDSRPLTAKSSASGVSIKSDLSRDSSHDAEYDKLPPELRTQGPQILRYRRESHTPKRKLAKPQTRMEKFKAMKSVANNERQKRTRGRSQMIHSKTKDVTDNASKTEEIVNISRFPCRMGPTAINFSLSSKVCADQGWITHPSQETDPEGHQWATARLQEFIRKREETKLTAKLRGEDGPLVVCYYSDSHYARSLRGGRHQRGTSLPLPVILNKLSPSISATFSTYGQHDMLLPNDGGSSSLCLLQLPDGSGFCNYFSGRRAISMSRKGDGSRGLYTIVYDNTESNNLIGYFMPNGTTACYHRNGSIYMMTDCNGGSLLDEEGFEIRRWDWPPISERMPQTIRIQLNTHIVVQCTGNTQMILKFSCHGQMHRFPVGLVSEYLSQDTKNESFWMKRTDIISNTLQTSYTFQSNAAAKLSSLGKIEGEFSKLHSRETIRHSGKDRKLVSEDSFLMESHCNMILWKADSYLEEYKSKITNFVNEWLNHYRQLTGIPPPPPTPSYHDRILNSSGSCQRSIGFRSRQGSRHLVTRTSSHNLTTCSVSPEMSYNVSVAAASEIMLSALNEIVEQPKLQGDPHPFKVDSAKPQQSPPVPFKPGCPTALHVKLVEKLTTIPKCKCDRRHLPLIHDLEYDMFLKHHIPNNQLVIVYIANSLSNESNCELLLESINYNTNTNRYAPCEQSAGDKFRILKYDLVHAQNDIKSSKPLLVERHHVFPGMFLIYIGHHLLAGITGFNGYGVTEGNFMKQVKRSLESGRRGHFLPADFKFSNSTVAGSKIHSRSLWVYPITGVLDEFISHTPSTGSSTPNAVGQPTFKRIYKC